MLGTTQAFIDRIDQDIEQTKNENGYGQVDIWILLQYLALDIIGETAFGKTFHMLEGNDHIVPRTINLSMKQSSYVMYIYYILIVFFFLKPIIYLLGI